MRTKLISLLALIILAGCTGGADTALSGIGNSNNFFGVDAEAELLARALLKDPNTPEVNDADLAKIYQVVRAAALDGDIRSAVVIYKLAARQRAEKEDE